MKVRNRICFCVIVFCISFIMLLADAAEEQTFRDELERHRSESELSYEKYQKELAKLLEPKPEIYMDF